MRPARRLTRAHLVWAVGVFAYLCAVSGRAAFGVASVEASARFGADGTLLSMFGVVQLGTYAAAQIPAGLFLDRLGPRRMLVLGALTMTAGQLLLALALFLVPYLATWLTMRLISLRFFLQSKVFA